MRSSRIRTLTAAVRHVSFWVPFVVTTYLAFAPSTDLIPPQITDTIAHSAAFFYLTIALWHAYYAEQGWRMPALWMAAYGIFIECVQAFLPEHFFEVKDLLVDAAGITAAVLGYRAARPWLRTVRVRDDGRTAIESGAAGPPPDPSP